MTSILRYRISFLRASGSMWSQISTCWTQWSRYVSRRGSRKYCSFPGGHYLFLHDPCVSEMPAWEFSNMWLFARWIWARISFYIKNHHTSIFLMIVFVSICMHIFMKRSIKCRIFIMQPVIPDVCFLNITLFIFLYHITIFCILFYHFPDYKPK